MFVSLFIKKLHVYLYYMYLWNNKSLFQYAGKIFLSDVDSINYSGYLVLYFSGNPIPRVDYTQEEINTW